MIKWVDTKKKQIIFLRFFVSVALSRLWLVMVFRAKNRMRKILLALFSLL